MPRSRRTDKEYAELGKAVSTLFETGAISKKELYKASFLRGLFSGLGGIVGATVGIAILLWLLSLFDQMPLIGRFIENVKTTIEAH